MAQDNQDEGEKEFEASEQKRQQARRDGNVAQSKEFNAFAVVAGVVIAALLSSTMIGPAILSDVATLFYHAEAFAADAFSGTPERTTRWASGMVWHVIPILALLVGATGLALLVQRSVSISAKKLQPKLNKLSPIENIKKRYGAKGLLDFAKDTAKMVFAGGIAIVFLWRFADAYYGSSAVQLSAFAAFSHAQVLALILAFAAFQLALALIDLPLQKRLHDQQLRMSREEMKKELKQNEGDPQVKQMRRSKAAKMSKGEMLAQVGGATVVMVNPTHYAVALKWDPASDRAPVCVAKGVDHLAARIRELAMTHGVPIYSDPPNTRLIYRTVDIDDEIRPEHFAAVVAAIQFVDRVKAASEDRR